MSSYEGLSDMEFPEREADILALALRIAELFERHPDLYPDAVTLVL